MSRTVGLNITVLILLTMAPMDSRALAQSPVSTTPVGDFLPPPPSFAQMIATSDLVVYGKVTKSGEPIHRRLSSGQDYVIRLTPVRVLELLAGRSSTKSLKEVSVRQVGGTVVVDGREISSAYDETLLQPAETVVLFLKQMDGEDSFYIAYGPGGLIRLDDKRGRASIPDRLRRLSDIGGRSDMPVDDLLTAIRKASHK